MRQSDKIKDGQRNQSPALIAHSAVGEGIIFSQKSEVYGIPGSEGEKEGNGISISRKKM